VCSSDLPLPGTTFYQRVQAQLGQKQNWVDSNDLAMMYHATYVPDFYRALHALVHAEFRARRAGDELKRIARHPARLELRHGRMALQFISRRSAMPFLQRRVDRLAAAAPSRPTVVPLPVLSQQAAAMPTEQPAYDAVVWSGRNVVAK